MFIHWSKLSNAVDYQQGGFTTQGARGYCPKQKIINTVQKYTDKSKILECLMIHTMSGDMINEIMFTLTGNQAFVRKNQDNKHLPHFHSQVIDMSSDNGFLCNH